MRKIKVFVMIIVCLFLAAMGNVYANSVTLSGSSSGSPNKNVTITVKGDFTGRVNLSVTNGKLSKNSVWIENNSQTVTVALGESGTTTVTATPAEGASDSEGNIVTISSKSKSISIKQPTTNINTNTNTNTTTKKSSNANISKLTLSVEGLRFKSSQTTYNIKVGEDVDQISVGVTLESSKATYKVTGNKGLTAGNNVIKIVVTAEDGTKKTYKINVEKKGNVEESSAELSNLIIEDMTLDKVFTATETEYVGSKMKYTEKLNILPYTVSEKAEYEIIGNENLKVGENTVTIKVTSYDETSTVEYKITFEMMSKEETNALQVVSPSANETPKKEEKHTIKQALIDNSTIILLYVLALVEFAQVVYLYVQLKNVNPEATVITRRRNKNQNKDKEDNI